MTQEERPKLSVPFSEKRDENYNYQKYARYSSHIAKTDDLEKELRTYINSQEYNESSGSGYLLVARHFAQWQKEQDERLIKLSHDSWYKEGFIYGKIEGLSEDEKYQQGRFDMKEQMLKDAISCQIEWYDGLLPNFTEEQIYMYLVQHEIAVGDKVNVIIIKED